MGWSISHRNIDKYGKSMVVCHFEKPKNADLCLRAKDKKKRQLKPRETAVVLSDSFGCWCIRR